MLIILAISISKCIAQEIPNYGNLDIYVLCEMPYSPSTNITEDNSSIVILEIKGGEVSSALNATLTNKGSAFCSYKGDGEYTIVLSKMGMAKIVISRKGEEKIEKDFLIDKGYSLYITIAEDKEVYYKYVKD